MTPNIYSPLGIHAIAEFHGLEHPEILKDLPTLRRLFIEALQHSRTKLVNIQEYQPSPQSGCTFTAIVQQSSADFHSWPDENYAGLSFFTCGNHAKPARGIRYLASALKPKIVLAKQISRGNPKLLEISPLVTKEKAKEFGYSLLLELYKCQRTKALNDLTMMYDLMEQLVKNIGMELQAPPFVFRSDAQKYPAKAGISAWVPLIESGLSVHTIVPTRFASFDLYSCKKFDPQLVIEHIRQIFKPLRIEDQWIVRGVHYQ